MWDLKQVHGVKRRKKKRKSATCALVREIQQNSDISGSRAHLNTVVTHKLRGTVQIHLPKSFADYVFGVADASNPNRWSCVCLGKLQISSTARRQRKKVSSPQTLTDAEFFHSVMSAEAMTRRGGYRRSGCARFWRPRPTVINSALQMFSAFWKGYE